MKDKLEAIKIEIPNNWLNSGYYVYIAEIHYKKNHFLYIGQTGDNYHKTARGPLYRISGHISKLTSSKQNQIVKGLRKHLSLKNEEDLENVMSKIKYNYTFYKINNFNYGDNLEKHNKKRKETQFIEHWLIYKLQDKVILFNNEVKTAITKANKAFFKEECKTLINSANSLLKELGYEG